MTASPSFQPAFDPQDPSYLAQFSSLQRWSQGFLDAYHNSLKYYKMFYNDISSYGNLDSCNEILYFIPGFNGTPGQIIFGLPGIIKHLGPNLYVRCLFVPEMSCQNPTWIKYTPEAMAAKRLQMVKDLRELVAAGKKVRVVVSSSGFYDFLAVYPEILDIKDQLILYWVSCAPDHVSPNRWEKFFYPLNGFEFGGCKWFSYPNVQALKVMNPECGVFTKFRAGTQRNRYYKNDLESRFYHKGLMWDFISIEYFNQVLDTNLAIFAASQLRMDMEIHVLAGIKDGFWDDSSPAAITATLDRYMGPRRVLFKAASHLWVVTPDHIYDLLQGT